MKQPADAYLIRNGHEWGQFFILGGRRDAGYQFGYLAAISTFGNVGYLWSNIGDRPFPEFLAGLEFNYAAEKLFGEKARVFNFDASVKNARERIKRARTEGDIDRAKERELLRAVTEITNGDSLSCEGWGHALRDALGTFWDQWEASDWCCVTIANPQAVGFWEQLWPNLIEALRKELRAHV